MSSDTPDTEQVVVIDRVLADRYFPGRDPIGQKLTFGGDASSAQRTIVGVVAPVKHKGLDDATPKETIYFPYRQRPVESFTLVLRTTHPPKDLIPRGAPGASLAGSRATGLRRPDTGSSDPKLDAKPPGSHAAPLPVRGHGAVAGLTRGLRDPRLPRRATDPGVRNPRCARSEHGRHRDTGPRPGDAPRARGNHPWVLPAISRWVILRSLVFEISPGTCRPCCWDRWCSVSLPPWPAGSHGAARGAGGSDDRVAGRSNPGGAWAATNRRAGAPENAADPGTRIDPRSSLVWDVRELGGPFLQNLIPKGEGIPPRLLVLPIRSGCPGIVRQTRGVATEPDRLRATPSPATP